MPFYGRYYWLDVSFAVPAVVLRTCDENVQYPSSLFRRLTDRRFVGRLSTISLSAVSAVPCWGWRGEGGRPIVLNSRKFCSSDDAFSTRFMNIFERSSIGDYSDGAVRKVRERDFAPVSIVPLTKTYAGVRRRPTAARYYENMCG